MFTVGPAGKTIVCDETSKTKAIVRNVSDSSTASALRARAEVVKTGTPGGSDA